MITLNMIREDLKDIKYFYSRKKAFDSVNSIVGQNDIYEKAELYNKMVRSASPRLYDIYVSLYTENHTQESLADKLGYTGVYISMLNKDLLIFFQKKLLELEEEHNGK